MRRLVVAAGVAVVGLLLVVAGLGVVAGRRPGRPNLPQGAIQRSAPALSAVEDDTRGAIAVTSSEPVVAGPDVVVSIEPAVGAVEMQIGFDPTFRTTAWVPVTDSAVLSSNHVGHQMIFARFRSGPDRPASPVSVDGIVIDPTYDAAVSADVGVQQSSWARPLSPSVIVVRIEAGRLQRGAQETYDFDHPPPGDRVRSGLLGFGEVRVERDGVPFGEPVDGVDGVLKGYDRLVGRAAPTDMIDKASWSVSSSDDAAYARPLEPLGVTRVSRPGGGGRDVNGDRITPLIHDVVLRLPAELAEGATYEIRPPGVVAAPVRMTFDPSSTISPAVHVNQNGYGVDDPLKVGYLSAFVPAQGAIDHPEGLSFFVVEFASRSIAAEGRAERRPDDGAFGHGDLTGSTVDELDFSTLDRPGRYQLCVQTVGCSMPFTVDDEVWTDLAVRVARAMYHQRSGVALGPPYSAIGRPRPYHPDDGMVVQHSDFRLIDGFEVDLGQRFERLVAAGTGAEVAGAWGGHFDAGDWDRRIQHLYYTRAVAELVELHPERFEGLDLSIPESGDNVPDLLDEGLWSLDLYRRLQGDDGSIRGGIEAAEHPQGNQTSWTDTLAVHAFAPDPWSSYLYAGVAAQVAVVLERYDPARAAAYADSALAAASWAEAQPTESNPALAARIVEQRSVAAAALLKLTGELQWHDVFVEASTLDDGIDGFLSCHEHGRCDAGWIYLSIDPSRTESALRSLIEESFIASAEEIVTAGEQTSFGWVTENRSVPLVWGLGPGGSPSSIGLLRAYELSGDERFRATALRSAAVSLGANPTNTVFVTGVGRQPVRHPLIVDVLNGGLATWAGTPVYGPHQLNALSDDSWVDDDVLGPAGVTPLASEVPFLWQWFDVPSVAMFNEFTVFQSHAEAVHAYGLLGAFGS